MMLPYWNIQDEQLHCFIRDGGLNIVRAIHLADILNASCTVHQLQLCVRSAFETLEVKNLITKFKKISGHFSHSQIAQDELTKIQTDLTDILTNSSEGEEETENDSNNNSLMLWKLLINEYNKENRLKLDDEPLLWWKNNIKYKDVSPIVRSYLSAQSSSVPSEQLFNSAGLIYEPLRNRLEDILLFLSSPSPLIFASVKAKLVAFASASAFAKKASAITLFTIIEQLVSNALTKQIYIWRSEFFVAVKLFFVLLPSAERLSVTYDKKLRLKKLSVVSTHLCETMEK
ncbi:hypothetical protein EVAR_82871_1 [Eumeta japonica]|uniref:HAT C-terminal dimerisation domain-containing protein n=1 Tax=Eumeta variegata TaxID=151549 RepID=A0A4C1V2M6_EUMVA|nr:hypothetical protein EVAR_82871_1 [Eumeta japonica]